MNVLFLMFAFPDMNTSFNMYTSLVDMFNKNGHSVTVVAPGIGIKRTSLVVENEIEVLRIKTMPIKNVSIFKKGLANILLPYQYKWGLNKFYSNQDFDLIIIPTPPITLGSLAKQLKRKYQSKVYLILRDIFPQNAVDLGFMKNKGLLHKFFQRKERNFYKISDYIGCMSEANIDFIINRYPISSEKLHILRNWQYLYKDDNINELSIIERYGLKNKFIVVFGGNMGKPQQIENVLNLAEKCRMHADIVFLLIGEGVMMDKIKKKVEERKLYNIHIHNSIQKDEYQQLLSCCDVGLISLHQNFTIPNIPSKSLDYWNVGLPILASIDKATDFGVVLDESKTGLWSYAGDHEKFYNNLLQLYRNPSLREEFSRNGKRYFKNNLTPEKAYDIIIEKIIE